VEILAIGVEEGSEAADERSADLVGTESRRTDEADRRNAARMDGTRAS
jgi:hypothetical protein